MLVRKCFIRKLASSFLRRLPTNPLKNFLCNDSIILLKWLISMHEVYLNDCVIIYWDDKKNKVCWHHVLQISLKSPCVPKTFNFTKEVFRQRSLFTAMCIHMIYLYTSLKEYSWSLNCLTNIDRKNSLHYLTCRLHVKCLREDFYKRAYFSQ